MLRQLQYNFSKLFNFPNAEKDERVQNMLIQIQKRGGLKFNIKINNGEGWVAECENLKGIITGGTNNNPTKAEIDNMIKDAIFTAFEIPPYLCKDNLIKDVKERVKEIVYA